MYNLMIFIVLIFFIIYNFYKYNKEYFSNGYQDTDLRAKLSYHGTNLSPIKPLLTLYFDRREPNCKYFYDYFSTTFGGLKKGGDHNLRFQSPSDSIYSGKSQPWNQLKEIYSRTNSDIKLKLLKPVFLTIEEIEVKDGHLYDFNNKPALRIKDGRPPTNIGYIEYDGKTPREYRQYLKPKDFLKRIPWITLSFFKHKDKKEIDELIKEQEKPYGELKDFQKYEYYVIEYDGIYSPNNRQIKATLDNIIKFINDTYEKYLKCPDQARHNSRIGKGLDGFDDHEFDDNKCRECSEYFIV
jgi:hypothetical protein